MRSWLLQLTFLATGLAVGSCFSAEGGFSCNPGEGGCQCNEGVCLEGLQCTMGYCTRKGCTPGTEFCVCDDAGACVDDLECFEGIVCRPTKGKGDPTGASGSASETDSGGSSSGGTTSAGSTGQPSTSGSSGSGDCEPACEECMTCSVDGTCVPDPGGPCTGPALQCEDYIHGLVDGTCHALAPAEVLPRCNGQGSCVPAIPQDCDLVQGDPIAVCDASCLLAPGLCSAYAPVDGLDQAVFCEQDGTTPECATFCFNGSYSEVNVNVCSAGTCVQIDETSCDAYACANGACNTSCAGQVDCSMFNVCDTMSQTCAPP